MVSRFLLDFYKGFVVATITGPKLPELINLANEEGLWIRNIVYRRNGDIQLILLRSDIRRLIPLLRRTGSKIHFEKRTGLPFLWQRAWRRKAFVTGCLLFVALLYSGTSIIWSVEVVGNKKLSPETVLAAAETMGLHKGSWIQRLPDTDVLQAEIVDKVPELSGAIISIQGTKVQIQVLEKIPPVKYELLSPQHIVAAKTAVIEKVRVEKGMATVQTGQLVRPGEIVISGNIGGGKSSVHAKGIVEAKVWYTTPLEVPLTQTQKVYTGEAFKKNFLVLGSLPIQVWGYGQTPYTSFEEQGVDHEYHIGSFQLPIKFRKVDVKETSEEMTTLSEEEGKTEALKRVEANIMSLTGGNGRIISQKILHQRIEHGNLYIKVLSEVIEDIGKPQPF